MSSYMRVLPPQQQTSTYFLGQMPAPPPPPPAAAAVGSSGGGGITINKDGKVVRIGLSPQPSGTPVAASATHQQQPNRHHHSQPAISSSIGCTGYEGAIFEGQPPQQHQQQQQQFLAPRKVDTDYTASSQGVVQLSTTSGGGGSLVSNSNNNLQQLNMHQTSAQNVAPSSQPPRLPRVTYNPVPFGVNSTQLLFPNTIQQPQPQLSSTSSTPTTSSSSSATTSAASTFLQPFVSKREQYWRNVRQQEQDLLAYNASSSSISSTPQLSSGVVANQNNVFGGQQQLSVLNHAVFVPQYDMDEEVVATGVDGVTTAGSGANNPQVAVNRQPPQQHHYLQQLQQLQESAALRSNSVASSGDASSLLAPSLFRTRKPCNCTKSMCLKLYCDCFANGEFCRGCNCTQCHNNLAYEQERSQAIKSCLVRNPYAFYPKIGKAGRGEAKESSVVDRKQHLKGCHCKKSSCLKNYCECYEAKVICSLKCRCIGCHNTLLARHQKRPDAPISITTGYNSNNNVQTTADATPAASTYNVTRTNYWLGRPINNLLTPRDDELQQLLKQQPDMMMTSSLDNRMSDMKMEMVENDGDSRSSMQSETTTTGTTLTTTDDATSGVDDVDSVKRSMSDMLRDDVIEATALCVLAAVEKLESQFTRQQQQQLNRMLHSSMSATSGAAASGSSYVVRPDICDDIDRVQLERTLLSEFGRCMQQVIDYHQGNNNNAKSMVAMATTTTG